MEVSWRNYGIFMELFSWNFYGENLDWNMEKTCRLDTLENRRLEKTKTRYNGAVRGTNLKGLKMLRKIADWATSESGKEVLTGVIVGIVGIIAVRLFCFIVCLATGYPIN